MDAGEEYWVSSVKKRRSNAHSCEGIDTISIDEDVLGVYNRLRRKEL